jgi:Coenzyme PQQ synthesis protein D (PqqD)
MAWQTIDHELVLLECDGNQLMGINDAGAHIWALMDGVRTIADIARAMAEEFDAPFETLVADVRAFVQELKTLGAVVT